MMSKHDKSISDIDVSVCITTYYHEKYIRQAIESVLNQKFNKTMEICVSDDASADGTVEILNEYKKKYKFFRLNVNKTNVGLTQNMFMAKEMARGKFLVMLSGDDYYIDEYKIQKQYDFLQNNPDFFGVATTIELRLDNNNRGTKKYPLKRYRDKEFRLNDFLKGKNFPLSGMMYKNVLIDKKSYSLLSMMPRLSKFIDDISDSIFLLQIGRVYVLPDCCTVYRVRSKIKNDKNFNSINRGLSNYEKHIEALNNLDEYLVGQVSLYYRYKVVLQSFWFKSFLYKQHRRYKEVYKTIPLKYKKRWLYFRVVITSILMLPFEIVNKAWRRIHE